MIETRYEHVIQDDNGIPFIKDTNTKVIEIIAEYLAYGWSPEEIQFQHKYLTLGQIHSSFAYYWDHTEKMNSDLLDIKEKVSNFRSKLSSLILQNKLKARKTG